MPLPDRKDKFEPFLAWCSDNGVDTSKVGIYLTSGSVDDYSLMSKQDVPADSLVFTIPRKMMMTTESALIDSEFGVYI